MSLQNKKDLVLEILSLSIEITNNSDVDVFCDYSGHTNGISIRVMLNGWSTEFLEPDFYKIIYLDRVSVNDIQEIIDYLEKVKESI